MKDHSRTKIVATLGPASDQPGQLAKMIGAGLNVARINYSHGQLDDHEKRIRHVREVAKQLGEHIGVIADLQGPKIRIGAFENGSVELQKEQIFNFNLINAQLLGNDKEVYLDCATIQDDVEPGRIVVLDDGRIQMEVISIDSRQLSCRVLNSCQLSDFKGFNILGGGLSAPCFTDKDAEDLRHAIALEVDFIALSFVKSAADIVALRQRLQAMNSETQIIAKIETVGAVADIDAISEIADGLMIARGDLAVEIGAEKVPAVQKKLVECARRHAKPVIVATQMMESMVTDTTPTRAEVSDVANAVLDGVDAVMLSSETAVGQHPSKVISVMANICLSVEQHVDLTPTTLLDRNIDYIHEGIAFAAMYAANQLGARCLAALTESGTTTRWMSRIRSNKIIYGLSRHPTTLARMSLYKGVVPMFFDVMQCSLEAVGQDALQYLVEVGCLTLGDHIVLTKGDRLGVHGGTNSMKVLTVKE